MPAVSSIFLVAALILAVVVGPQMRPWTWGPAILALGISLAMALPSIWKKDRFTNDFGLTSLGLLVASWFAWRAWISPVDELGQADLLLLAGAVGAFISVRSIEGNKWAESILIWGIALLLVANVIAVGRQVTDPDFSPVFRLRATVFPSGFYAHYNEAANYLIASSLLVAAAAVFGNHRTLTRIIWATIAFSGLVAVYFTHSRGGILGVAVGIGVFGVSALIVAKRNGSRWFAPALITIPIVGILAGGFLYYGWEEAQMARSVDTAKNLIEGVMDNNSRLVLLGIAVSCIAMHPLAGGGSRSFSWECFQFSNAKNLGGVSSHKPDQVHNELVQAATDYGLIGAGLLILLLTTSVIVAVMRMIFSEEPQIRNSADAWRVGGLAAFAGMFIQSNFSFVFHLMPGVILLGICLGQVAHSSQTRQGKAQTLGTKVILSGVTLGCLALLFPIGWNGSRVTSILWPSYFSKVPQTESSSRIDALSEAISVWPQPSLYQERAIARQSELMEVETKDFREQANLTIRDYEKAEILHPFDPVPAINRANILSQLEQDTEAEAAYYRAIQLQGGLEQAIRGHFSLAYHLFRRALRQFSTEDPSLSLSLLELAAQQIEKSGSSIVGGTTDFYELRVSIHEGLGTAREASGDYQGAMDAYNLTTTLPYGSRAHYQAGVLNGKLAVLAWSDRRPGDALGYFMEAKNRIAQTSELPQGVTPSQKIEYLAYLDAQIAFLKGAKIEAVPKNSALKSR